MPKKIKRVPLGSTPYGAYEDAKTRFKHQALMQDYQDLHKEVEEKRSELEAVGQRKLILLAEVRYLKRRYKNLVEYKCDNPSQGGLDQVRTSGTKCKSKIKNQFCSKKEAIVHNVSSKVVSHQKGRLHVGKEAMSRKSVPLFEVDEEKELGTGKDVAFLNTAPVSIINNTCRIYREKETDLQNLNSVLGLNQNTSICSRSYATIPLNITPPFDLDQKEKMCNEKEAASRNRAPVFDLNEVSREDEEFQECSEPMRVWNPKKGLIRGENYEQLDVRLPICWNAREGSTCVAKREISLPRYSGIESLDRSPF